MVFSLIPLLFSQVRGSHRQPSFRASFSVHPIGSVIKEGSHTTIVLDKNYQPGLMGLENFSHVYVFYWFHRNDTPEKRSILQVHPRADQGKPLRGVFATRSPVRPNLIAQSLCRVLSIKKNVIEIDKIDALPDTPVIDIKPFIPDNDYAENSRIPEWLEKILQCGAEKSDGLE